MTKFQSNRGSICQKHKVAEIIRRLENQYPDARISLSYNSPLELLVATILSAQCTDACVNKITPKLFSRYKTALDYANASLAELELFIRSTGFYHIKAERIIGMAQMLQETYSGQVPCTMEQITTLPGVARKTGNVVLYNAYGITEGIAVDTHVTRFSMRVGLSNASNPDIIEKDLMQQIPKEKWGEFTHLVIAHGRAICVAKKAKCTSCTLNGLCMYFNNIQ